MASKNVGTSLSENSSSLCYVSIITGTTVRTQKVLIVVVLTLKDSSYCSPPQMNIPGSYNPSS